MKLDDTVLVRIVQIIQEAMLTGTDCVDFMRLIELKQGTDENKLVLTEAYLESVEKEHKKLLDFANAHQSNTDASPSTDVQLTDNDN